MTRVRARAGGAPAGAAREMPVRRIVNGNPAGSIAR